jgi:hypothetical protein
MTPSVNIAVLFHGGRGDGENRTCRASDDLARDAAQQRRPQAGPAPGSDDDQARAIRGDGRDQTRGFAQVDDPLVDRVGMHELVDECVAAIQRGLARLAEQERVRVRAVDHRERDRELGGQDGGGGEDGPGEIVAVDRAEHGPLFAQRVLERRPGVRRVVGPDGRSGQEILGGERPQFVEWRPHRRGILHRCSLVGAV